jgi:hypothetical protein
MLPSDYLENLVGAYAQPERPASQPDLPPLAQLVEWLQKPDAERWPAVRAATSRAVTEAQVALEQLLPQATFATAHESFARTLEWLALMQRQLEQAEVPQDLDRAQWTRFLQDLQGERTEWLSWQAQQLCPHCGQATVTYLSRCQGCGSQLLLPDDEQGLDWRENQGKLPADVARLRELLLHGPAAQANEQLQVMSSKYRQAARLLQRPVGESTAEQNEDLAAMAGCFEQAAALTGEMAGASREQLERGYRELCGHLAEANRLAARVKSGG